MTNLEVKMFSVGSCLFTATLLHFFFFSAVEGTCYSTESCLYDHLFTDYNSQVRPSLNPTVPVEVSIAVDLNSILNLDEKKEVLQTALTIESTWNDFYLSYNLTEYNVDFILVQAERVWLPDFTVTNTVKNYFDSTYYEDFKVYISNSGNVLWNIGGIYDTTCSLILTNYPFDTQLCSIVIENWAYTEELVNITTGDFFINEAAESSLWEISSAGSTRETVYIYGNTSIAKPRLTLTLSLKRRTRYYVMNLVVPCLLVTCAALGVFWLPAECGEKISLGITVLLAYVVFQIVIMDQTPTNSQDTPFISKLVISIMALTTLSVIVSMVTAYVTYKKTRRRVPKWLRSIAFQILAKAFFLHSEVESVNEVEDVETENSTNPVIIASINENKEKPNVDKNYEKLESILQEMRCINAFLNEKVKEDAVHEEWRLLALIIDRLCFWTAIVLFVIIALPVIFTAF